MEHGPGGNFFGACEVACGALRVGMDGLKERPKATLRTQSRKGCYQVRRSSSEKNTGKRRLRRWVT